MICRPCRLGADLIHHDGHSSTTAVEIGRRLHDKCHGCDCQHNVDAQLNKKAIR